MNIKDILDLAVSINSFLYDIGDTVEEMKKIDITNSETYPELLPVMLNKIESVESKLSQLGQIIKVFIEKIESFIGELYVKRNDLISCINKDGDLSNKGIIEDLTKTQTVLSIVKREYPYHTEIIEINDPAKYSCLSILGRLLVDDSKNDIDATLSTCIDLQSLREIVNELLGEFRELKNIIKSSEFVNAIQSGDDEFVQYFKCKQDDIYKLNPTVMGNIYNYGLLYIKNVVTSLFRAVKAIGDNFKLYKDAVMAYKNAELQSMLPASDPSVEIC